MKNLISKISGALFAGYITLVNPARAETIGTAEIMAGYNSACTDIKVLVIDFAPRTSLFARQINNIDYQGNVSPFGLADLTFNIVDGLAAIVELQFSDAFTPRFGLQYFKQIGNTSLFGGGTVNLKDLANFEIFASAAYNPKIDSDKKAYFSLEEVTNFGVSGHNFSSQKLRGGLELKGWRFGPALELAEPGQGKAVDYNVGGFVAKTF